MCNTPVPTRKLQLLLLPRQLGVSACQDLLLLRWSCCLSGLMLSTAHWTGNALVLPHKAERIISNSLLLMQGYIQLLSQTSSHLPDFGTSGRSSTVGTCDAETAVRTAPHRLGKASKSVSIFARDPLCRDTCRYCRRRLCDVGCAR